MAKMTTRRARVRSRIAFGVGIALVLALVGSVWAATSSAGPRSPRPALPAQFASDQVGTTTTRPTYPNGFPVHETLPPSTATASVTPPTAAPNPWSGYRTTVAPGSPIQFTTTQVGWRLSETGGGGILDRGLRSGEKGSVLGTAVGATTDGGRTWTTVYHDPTGIWGIDLLTPQVGWVVGVTSLERTTDGGATWKTAGEPTGTHLVMVDFVTASLGYGLTTKGTLVRSDDAGEAWSVIPTFAPLQSICFTSADAGIAANTRTPNTPENLYTTSDSGSSWVRRGTNPAHGYGDYTKLSCAGSDAVAVTTIIATPTYGYFVETSSNGGATWALAADRFSSQNVALPTAPTPLNGVSSDAGVNTAGTFALVGVQGGVTSPATVSLARGVIGSTTLAALALPAEATWAIPSATSSSHYGAIDLLGADLVGPTTGWLYVVTASASQEQWAVLHTSDGGTSWSVQWVSAPAALPARY